MAEDEFDKLVLEKASESGSLHTGIAYGELLTRKRQLLEEYEELLSCIRQQPACENFLRASPFEEGVAEVIPRPHVKIPRSTVYSRAA